MESIRSEQQRQAFATALKRKTKLVAAGKAQRFAFPGGGDPDDLDRLRKQYKQANGNQPLWDEPTPTAVTVSASALQGSGFAQILNSCIEQKLGRRSAKNWRASALKRRRSRTIAGSAGLEMAKSRLPPVD